MCSKNTLDLIESHPQRLKTVHKYSRTFISLLQRTTNQITPLASTLKKQNHLPLAPTTELLESLESLDSMSRAIFTRSLVRKNSRFYKVAQQKNKSNTLDRDDVTKGNRQSQNNPIIL